MRKKIILLLFTAIIVMVIVLITFPHQETVGLPDPLEQAEMLVALTVGVSGESGNEELMYELANREDAIGYAANLVLAESMLDREADVFFRRALELYDSGDVRQQLAEWMEAKGDEMAVTEYLALLPDRQAMATLERLGADHVLVLDTLVAGGHWQAIIDYLDTEDDDSALADTYQIYLGQALVNRGLYKQALPILAELAVLFARDDTVLWHYGRALEGTGNVKEAIEVYDALGPLGGQRLGRLYEQASEKLQAAEAYSKSEEPAARWRGAILWEELENQESALPLYRKLAEEPGSYQDDALFRSYVLLVQEDHLEAEHLLEQLLAYPVWAERLGLELSWPTLKEIEHVESALLARLDAYRDAEREDLIQAELDIAWRNATVEDKVALGQWYLERGDYRQVVRWGIGALRDLPAKETYELAYPRPFRTLVEQAAAEFHLEPALIWAVMREESRFQPVVASRVGAMGLMQVMPATGKEIAERLKVDFIETDLTVPEVNIRFGAYYLRSMLNRFDQDLDKALAAYNGGPGNAQRWSNSIIGDAPNGFPTAVTYFETRQYITKVRDVYLTYQWLYDNH
jgi:soluble lytic murein transglycosylase